MTTDPDNESAADAASGDPIDSTPPPPPRPRRLTRSRTDEWFGGVAGGLAEYLDTDPTLIRAALVLAVLLTSGLAILGYIAAWIIIPEAPSDADGATTARTRSGGRSGSGAMLWGGILVIGGSLLLLMQLDVDVPLPPLRVGLAVALICVGLLMLVEARRGFHGGLVTLAIVLTVILGAGATSDVNLAVDGAFGEQRHEVVRAEDLRNDYSHAFGSLTLDLQDLELADGITTLKVNVAFGEATILIPDDLPYRLDGSSFFGSIQTPGFETGGIAGSRTYTSPGYDEATAKLDIGLSAAFGTGRVR